MYCRGPSYSTCLNLWCESESLSLYGETTRVWEILVGTRLLQLRVKSAQARVKVQQLTITVSKPWLLNSQSVDSVYINVFVQEKEKDRLMLNTALCFWTVLYTQMQPNNVACHCLRPNKSNTILHISCLYISQPWWRFMSDSPWIMLKYSLLCLPAVLFCPITPCTMCLQYNSKTRCSGLEWTPPALIIPNGKHTFQKIASYVFLRQEPVGQQCPENLK